MGPRPPGAWRWLHKQRWQRVRRAWSCSDPLHSSDSNKLRTLTGCGRLPESIGTGSSLRIVSNASLRYGWDPNCVMSASPLRHGSALT
eukprot:9926263-Alexandrium_andersonii.AAC.1